MQQLMKKIKYEFRDASLLRAALTHSSHANENRSAKIICNERLEFLGDAVLNFVTAEYLYQSFPELPEGELTKVRAAVVCEGALHDIARSLDLGGCLLLGRGEQQNHGRERASILADAVEAVLAAVYLDGGMEAARRFILEYIPEKAAAAVRGGLYKDYKTQLQEIVQKNRQETLSYVMAGEHGPDHEKQFTVEVYLNSNPIATGTGRSKKEAEQQAARAALALMGEA